MNGSNGTVSLAMIEAVECRRMLADVSVVRNGTVIEVTGTNAGDTILLTEIKGGFRDEDIFLRIAGQSVSLFEGPIDRIEVRAGGGNDVIQDFRQFFGFPIFIECGDGDDKILRTGDEFITFAPLSANGGAGNDTIEGGFAGDRISGDLGNDRIYGYNGRDRLSGGGGKDRLYGGTSGDWLYGQGGDDQLSGEGGNDRLSGGGGNDTLHGNAGNDTLVSSDGSIDSLFGDGGSDSATADEDDVLLSIENLE